jgi:1-piperideine-2-carboxylate/1-pyrroline-2-carboxylate reductase [NAD(P)H]
MKSFDAAATAKLLDFPRLVAGLSRTLLDYEAGGIACPERLVVPCGGDRGMLLSMPSTADDISVHKLLTIYAGNPAAGLPTIQGHVTCFDAKDGTALFSLDGPTVTARRTASITMIGIRHLAPRSPRHILLIGMGAQAHAHAEAILELYPDATVHVLGRSPEAAAKFCARYAARVEPAAADSYRSCEVVIAVTNSKTPVYDEAADPGRLVIGVGAYRLDMLEIGSALIQASQIYVDDRIGAPGEAGDVVAAGTDWGRVKPLATALTQPPDFSRPIFLKSVGCAAWDLAACRTARDALDR